MRLNVLQSVMTESSSLMYCNGLALRIAIDRHTYCMQCNCSKDLSVNWHLPLFCTHNAADAGTDDGCPKFPLVSNIFKCKTEIEWEGLARKQCQIRLEATVETVITSVRYPCRFGRRSSGVRVFQQVEVSCCPELSSSGTLQPTGSSMEYI